MRAYRWLSWLRALALGLDLMYAGLVLLAVAGSADRGPAAFWTAVAVGAASLALYALGRRLVRVHERSVTAPRGRWWPDTAWIAALTVLWCALLLVSPTALWLAFPLFLLQMHVLGPHRGLLAVVVTTTIVVVDGVTVAAPEGTVPIGFVLGPVLGAAVAVGVVLGFEALVRESEERQATVDELVQARDLLADAERDRLVREERERMAREIHDTLAQGFSAIELLLRAATTALGRSDDARAAGHVRQAGELARHNLDEARRFVRALAPPDLDDATLVGALDRVAERYRAQGLVVTVRTEGRPRPLPVPVETALLRIAQSALANVDQHADAGQVEIVVDFTHDDVVLDVVDDGAGFDPAAPVPSGRRGGFGIAAMRSRAEELGGSLALESAPGEGTALTVTVPATSALEPR
ncbi:MAG: histidine kinase [Pseudonocardia sp.]|nr:histidine kinase [Pseudonocardia sp.]